MSINFYLASSIEYLRHLRESIMANSRTLALIGQIDHQMPPEAILIVEVDTSVTFFQPMDLTMTRYCNLLVVWRLFLSKTRKNVNLFSPVVIQSFFVAHSLSENLYSSSNLVLIHNIFFGRSQMA